MRWLGKCWDDVRKELSAENTAYTADIAYPAKKVNVGGVLRVARITQEQEKLKIILVYDRFSKC